MTDREFHALECLNKPGAYLIYSHGRGNYVAGQYVYMPSEENIADRTIGHGLETYESLIDNGCVDHRPTKMEGYIEYELTHQGRAALFSERSRRAALLSERFKRTKAKA